MARPLDKVDLSASLSRDDAATRIAAAQRRLVQLRLFSAGLLERHEVGPALLVIFEGFDAAGKGGAIRYLTSGIDPRHVRVVPVAAPTTEELRHHFLWRFQATLPGRGGMTVFDRSWYGRLLVERVEGLIDMDTVRRSAREIVDFEDMLVDDDTIIVKFWLHLSDEKQLERFNDRATDPLKQWKLTDEDWRNRAKRAEYIDAVNDMVEWTDHPHAHWDLVSGESKHSARVTVLETVIQRWVHDLERRGVKVPKAHGGDYLK